MVRGRSARIGVDSIAAAVIEIGFSAATTGAVAKALGVEQPAIYRHVGSKAEMLDLAAARALDGFAEFDGRDDVADAGPDGTSWRDMLLRFQTALWSRLDAVAGLSRYLLSVPLLPVPLLVACEGVVSRLSSAGIAGRTAVLSVDALVHLTCLAHVGSERMRESEASEGWAERMAALADPGIRSVVVAVAETGPRELAAEQLDILLDGIQTRGAGRSRSGSSA